MSGEGKTVCVTGASGYIASWLVKFLLQRGYTVKASVRSLSDPKKTEHLLALEGAKERLHLFEANLVEEGSFDAGVADCECVFHTASPFFLETENPEVDLIEPAVKGTMTVLASCAKTPSVKRVVLTSSAVSMVYNGTPLTPDVFVDETWWSSSEFCRNYNMWYMVSKTLAEEAAWKYAKENKIDLVTINPGLVIGPLLQPTLNTSAAFILSLVSGSETYPNASHTYVDVRDVALAHILAFETPSASGRYATVERVAHFTEVLEYLSKHYPSIYLPTKCEDNKPPMPRYNVSTVKAKSLGIDFITLEQSVKDTVNSLKEKKFF